MLFQSDKNQIFHFLPFTDMSQHRKSEETTRSITCDWGNHMISHMWLTLCTIQ